MELLELCEALIEKPSISPSDEGCQKLLADLLSTMGFEITHLPFGDVKNLWARLGNSGPLFVFAGHTDVVPAGDENLWSHPPFKATVVDNELYGRGSVDMKTALVAMIIATKQFLKQNEIFSGSIAFLITSDEEAEATHGSRKVVEHLKQQNIFPDYCLVGEPSSVEKTGDQIRIGRRGSLSAKLIINGEQGHVAYPEKAINALHIASEVIIAMNQEQWDQGNEDFPATTLQFSNIQSGTGVNNVIPGNAELHFNFRFSPESTAQSLQAKTQKLIDRIHTDYQLEWKLSGDPFYSPEGKLRQAVNSAVSAHTGLTPTPSTGGGTSDGRFIAKICPEVIELGLPNKTIHAIDEHCHINEIQILTGIYQEIMQQLFT